MHAKGQRERHGNEKDKTRVTKMEVFIGNEIKIKNPTEEVRKWARCNLVVDNPDFYKKERMGKWLGGTPREIYLFETVGNEWRLPFGVLRDIWSMIKTSPYDVKFCPIRPLHYESSINLYPYQEEAVMAALRVKNGVLVMPCGSGKTQSGLEIIARVGGRALWLTHTQDLLNQSKKRAECVLGGAGLGTITAGKVKIGTHITFATVQTMCKIRLAQYADYWDVIIVDECQHACGTPTRVTQFYSVISQLSARYKIGLTATPKRADGLEIGMFSLLGGIIHTVTREAVKNTTCPIHVRQISTGWVPNYDCVLCGDGTIDYSKVVEDMTCNEERFKTVRDEILALEGATIVLGNRVEYLQRMCDDLVYRGRRCVCLSGMGQSKAAKAERKEALERLNNGDLDCICATYLLAKEGLDVPALRYVVFATPEKDETTVIQSVGRVGRKAEGKEYGTVLDFIDDFGMYKGWAKKRASYYRRLDAKIY